MKMLRRAELVVVALGMLQVPAWATTNQETFNKFVAKFAPSINSFTPQNFKPKIGCVCLSSLNPGFVALDTGGQVNCAVPFFNLDGSLGGEGFCTGDFVVLH